MTTVKLPIEVYRYLVAQCRKAEQARFLEHMGQAVDKRTGRNWQHIREVARDYLARRATDEQIRVQISRDQAAHDRREIA